MSRFDHWDADEILDFANFAIPSPDDDGEEREDDGDAPAVDKDDMNHDCQSISGRYNCEDSDLGMMMMADDEPDLLHERLTGDREDVLDDVLGDVLAVPCPSPDSVESDHQLRSSGHAKSSTSISSSGTTTNARSQAHTKSVKLVPFSSSTATNAATTNPEPNSHSSTTVAGGSSAAATTTKSTSSPGQSYAKVCAKKEDETKALTADDINKNRKLCPYGLKSNVCPIGDECTHLHGLLCDMCDHLCLHPYNERQRQEHHEVHAAHN